MIYLIKQKTLFQHSFELTVLTTASPVALLIEEAERVTGLSRAAFYLKYKDTDLDFEHPELPLQVYGIVDGDKIQVRYPWL